MIDEQITALETAVEHFSQCIASIGEADLLESIGSLGNWTRRDIVAHLVGWNRHVVAGSRQILKGELPFYDIDPGDDFANVNAELIRQYPSRDRAELLAELRRSKDELVAFLRSLDESTWAHDFGVRNNGETITVQSTVGDLIADSTPHQEQLDPR